MSIYFGKIFMRFGDFGATDVHAISDEALAGALVKLETVMAARIAMLCPDVTVQAAIVSNSEVRGDSLLSDVTPSVGTYDHEGVTTYDPTNTNLIRFTGTDFIHRSLRHIKFVPSDQFNVAGVFTQAAPWLAPRLTWMNAVVANTVVPIRIAGAVVPPFYTSVGIGNFVQEGGHHRKIGRPSGLPAGRRLTP